jgi:signal transduction histidine kinase
VAASSKLLPQVSTLKQVIQLPFLREDVFSLLGESADGVERVAKIVKDLKDFSHVDKADWQQVNVHENLESTLNVVRHELERKADVVKQFGDVPLLECLPFQLNQAFLNLLINACQAIEGHGTVTLRTERDGDRVRIQVTDTGRGIRPADLGRIFEPFFTTKPVGTGTGLGLSVAYSIVKHHGGTIEVASEPGKGSTFTVTLPLARATSAVPQP